MANRRQTRRRRRAGSGSGPTSAPRKRGAGSDTLPVKEQPFESLRASAPASPQTFRLTRADLPASAALGLLVAVAYLPAMLWGGFVWDDRMWTEAEAVRDWSGLWQIWFSPTDDTTFADGSPGRSGVRAEGHYWPMVYTSFWLEHKLWGFAPAGYHIVNVLLHFANTLLVWRLLLCLSVPGAWLAAALFAVHPVHVESVAWVIGRKDLLSTLFYLSALAVWLRFEQTPGQQPQAGAGRYLYLVALALFAAGMLSKSIVVTLPATLLIVCWWKRGRVTLDELIRILPFFLVGFAITLADLAYYAPREVDFNYSIVERMLIAATALWFYVGKLLWPMQLAVIYPHWDVDVTDPLAWGYVVGAAALVATLWRCRHQIGRGPLAGVLFFAITLSPALGFVDFGYMSFSFVADRYQYLASIGLTTLFVAAVVHGVTALAAAGKGEPGETVAAQAPATARHADAGVGQHAARGVSAWVVALALLAALGALSWRQTSIYRDEIAFYQHITSLNPQAPAAHGNLGGALIDAGRQEEALAVLHIAVEQDPDSINIRNNLGNALLDLDQLDEAARHLQVVLNTKPGHVNALRNLASVRVKQERLDEAAELYRRIGSVNPDQEARAHHTIASAFAEQGRFDQEEKHRRQAVKAAPDNTKTVQGLAEALRKQARYKEALDWYRVVIKIDPTVAPAHAGAGDVLFHLERYEQAIAAQERALDLELDAEIVPAVTVLMGRAEQALGRPEAAVRRYERALALDPDYPEAMGRLGMLHFEQQRYDEALIPFQKLVERYPDNAQFHSNLGATLSKLERNDEALRSLERALTLDPTLEAARASREWIRQNMAEPDTTDGADATEEMDEAAL